MKRLRPLLFAWTLGLCAATAAPPDEAAGAPHTRAVRELASGRLLVRTPAGQGELAVQTSLDWDRAQPQLRRAVIVVHGRLRDALTYYASLRQAHEAAGARGADTLLIAPQFLTEVDARGLGVGPTVLRWTLTGWQGGDDAVAPAAISAFEALDAIVARLDDRTRFPALREVVIAGHSGGGQVVQRYAVLGADPPPGLTLRYVVANPSSYAWFGSERPLPTVAATCPGYDDWKYGLKQLPRIAAGAAPATLEARYAARPVTLLLGERDTDPQHPALDKGCAAEAQGPYRLARGLAFHAALRERQPKAAETLATVPGVAHDGRAMFSSAEGLRALFGD
jgi:pimeloyl-ACP methyl ester carboxylesterase